VPARAYSDQQLEDAIDALTEPGRFREAETLVSRTAPRLQRILAAALAEGGWFDESHEAEVGKAAELDDLEARLTAIRTLIAEETRMGMLIGVAVGWALSEQLSADADAAQTESPTDHPQED
jgi:hypothetical protein